ncbi:MAG: beta-N-acetylhexosaminidase, partial [Spirochaetes bacterium]|nr:beta-N-acetylhexosaminidase [Spirochaetota bacterium]
MKPLRTATLIILPVALVLTCQLYPFNKLRNGEKTQYREDAMTTGAGIIPRPARVTVRSGSFDITPNTMVLWKGGSEPEARSLAAELSSIVGFSIAAAAGPESRGAIVLSLEKPGTGAESYELSVEKSGITLTAPSRAGLFLGTQTIRQLALLARQRGGGSLAIPCMEIEDAPRFSWRGLNLDCARHFPQKETVIRLIDLMTLYRMNVLHLHLTDDQGWRLEIKKYPKLTSVGAWRKGESGGRYGGFYTQDDIRQIVAYAAVRHVTVIPEIEMPGHCQAALAAYPELSCTGKKFPVSTRWGIHKEIYCAGKEETFRFLQDVLDEVMAIFPSPYIHVGGDECLKPRWKRCPLCQARIASEKLGDTKGLQSYFIRRMEQYISGKGRKLVGWDE